MTSCIVHVGMHKTGSSSIQQSFQGFKNNHLAYFEDYKGRSNHGPTIFGLLGTKGNDRPGSSTVKKLFSDKVDPKLIDRRAHENLEEALRLLGNRDLLISAEGMMFLSENELDRFYKLIKEKFDEVKIVAYVRPPAAYMTSLVQQRIKGGSKSKINIEEAYCNYQNNFSKFDKVFGRENVKLWKFDPKTFINGCVVMDFCDRLNLNFPKERVVRVNESLSREVMGLIFTYRRLGGNIGSMTMDGYENRHLLNRLVDIGNNKFCFSPDVINPILEKNRSDIEWMEERLGESLYEELGEYQPGDVRDESDLLEPDPEIVSDLLSLLGDSAPKGVKGETPEEVALLVHELRDDYISREKKPRKKTPGLNRGKIIRAESEIVAGWAIGDNYENPVRVALLVNGKEIAQTIANKMRKNIKERGFHPTGNCGFVFRFDSGHTLKLDDEVVILPMNAGTIDGDLSAKVSEMGSKMNKEERVK